VNSARRSIEPKFDVVDKLTDPCPAFGFQSFGGLLDQACPRKCLDNRGEPQPFFFNAAATDERFNKSRIGCELTADTIGARRTAVKIPAGFAHQSS
jgi:hypothetical protein